MAIWAIADLHLSFGTVGKEMDVFGPHWSRHSEKLASHWKKLVHPDDLVLIAGDISWALHLKEAIPDLQWIDKLPGTKVMIKGNHDLWCKSASKVRAILPPSIHMIYHDAFLWNDVAIGGTRLWDHPDISYSRFIEFRETPGIRVHKKEHSEQEHLHDLKIFNNELNRLALSIAAMDRLVKHRIVMVHYPPAGFENRDSPVMQLLKREKIDICLYGHLHNLRPGSPVNFDYEGVKVICTACDFLDFTPIRII